MSSHPIVHIELAANNSESAGKFYADAFGWKIEAVPQFNYATFEAKPGPGGGFVSVGGPSQFKPGDVLIYIGTDDIDASLAQVNKLGGKTITPKSEIPGVGWYAIFSDPTGNKIGLYTDQNPHH